MYGKGSRRERQAHRWTFNRYGASPAIDLVEWRYAPHSKKLWPQIRLKAGVSCAHAAHVFRTVRLAGTKHDPLDGLTPR